MVRARVHTAIPLWPSCVCLQLPDCTVPEAADLWDSCVDGNFTPSNVAVLLHKLVA